MRSGGALTCARCAGAIAAPYRQRTAHAAHQCVHDGHSRTAQRRVGDPDRPCEVGIAARSDCIAGTPFPLAELPSSYPRCRREGNSQPSYGRCFTFCDVGTCNGCAPTGRIRWWGTQVAQPKPSCSSFLPYRHRPACGPSLAAPTSGQCTTGGRPPNTVIRSDSIRSPARVARAQQQARQFPLATVKRVAI